MRHLYGGAMPMYQFLRGLLARGLPRACIPAELLALPLAPGS